MGDKVGNLLTIKTLLFQPIIKEVKSKSKKIQKIKSDLFVCGLLNTTGNGWSGFLFLSIFSWFLSFVFKPCVEDGSNNLGTLNGFPLGDEVHTNEHLEHFSFLGVPLNFFSSRKKFVLQAQVAELEKH